MGIELTTVLMCISWGMMFLLMFVHNKRMKELREEIVTSSEETSAFAFRVEKKISAKIDKELSSFWGTFQYYEDEARRVVDDLRKQVRGHEVYQEELRKSFHEKVIREHLGTVDLEVIQQRVEERLEEERC